MALPKTYTPAEAAPILKVNYTTVLELIKEGRLRASKIGRSYVITETAIEDLLAESENSQRQASLAGRSKKKCQSISDQTGSGIAILHTVKSGLDARLEQLTAPKRSKRTTRSNTNFGERRP